MWYENDGAGSFGSQQLIASIPNSKGVSVEFGDVDTDGDQDLLVSVDLEGSCGMAGSSYYSRVILFKYNGINNFDYQSIYNREGYSISSHFSDFNNDGKVDIMISADGLGNCQAPI